MTARGSTHAPSRGEHGVRGIDLSRAPASDLVSTVSVAVALVIVFALSLTAAPRRTGDAHQYLAMARQLSHVRPPSLSPSEEADYDRWLAAQPVASGFPDGAPAMRQPALIRDDRQELSHFWVYPLLTAPVMVMSDALGAHPLLAFVLTNAALLTAAVLVVTRVFGVSSALMLLASPLTWFVARAQVEVFTLSLLGLAMAAAATNRWGGGALALAVASTQNLPIAATIPLFWAAGLWRWIVGRRKTGLSITPKGEDVRSALVFGALTMAISLLHPAYSFWRLGVATPQQLNGGIHGGNPSWQRYFAVLVDPEIGVVWWVPVTAVLAFVGLWMVARPYFSRATSNVEHASPDDHRLAVANLVGLVMAAWFLFVFSQTTNVNSGGTVFVSRYGLWLLPLALPAISAATRRLDRWAPGLTAVGGVALFSVSLLLFRPDQPERYTDHSPQALWLMAHLPALYRPLPEIFVERTLHIDGGPRRSAADPSCRLIFLLASAPDQPCSLRREELNSAHTRFVLGDAAVWIRRDATGSVLVTTALPER